MEQKWLVLLGQFVIYNKGIAGIAGGDNDNNPGVSLYAMKIIFPNPINGRGEVDTDAAVSAIVDGAFSSPVRDLGQALHIGNHSWYGIGSESIFRAFNTSYINKVTSVAIMGNDGDVASDMPGRYVSSKDNQIIAVGGTGSDGNFIVPFENDGGSAYTPNYGPAVDIAAPGTKDIVFTLDEGPRGIHNGLLFQNDHSYHWFDGTSAAAPHVSGVAALMMSFKNSSTSSSQNLAPEDIEELLQLYATPLPNSTPNAPITTNSSPNDLTGYGRLNAGNVMEHLEPPYDVIHQEHETSIGAFTLFQSNATIDFSEGALSAYYTSNFSPIPPLPAPTVPVQEGTYLVDVYRYVATVSHNLNGNMSLLASWPRGSSSNVLFPFQTQSGSSNLLVSGDPGFTLSNVSIASATLEGYVYHIKDDLTNGVPVNTWFPFNPNSKKGAFAWTLHTKDWGTSISPEAEKTFSVEAFPNPNDGLFEVLIKTKLKGKLNLEILNIDGISVFEMKDLQIFNSDVSLNLNIKEQPSGVYFLKVSNEQENIIVKLIKI
jgi:hypothetical protein